MTRGERAAPREQRRRAREEKEEEDGEEEKEGRMGGRGGEEREEMEEERGRSYEEEEKKTRRRGGDGFCDKTSLFLFPDSFLRHFIFLDLFFFHCFLSRFLLPRNFLALFRSSSFLLPHLLSLYVSSLSSPFL